MTQPKSSANTNPKIRAANMLITPTMRRVTANAHGSYAKSVLGMDASCVGSATDAGSKDIVRSRVALPDFRLRTMLYAIKPTNSKRAKRMINGVIADYLPAKVRSFRLMA